MTQSLSYWVVGRVAKIESNGHEYIAEPFLVFTTELEADAACEMIKRVSGQRLMKAPGASYSVYATPPRGM